MSGNIILYIVIGIIGIWLGAYFGKVRAREKAKPAVGPSSEKERNLDKIMLFVEGRETVTNNDIEKLLSVSDATATRYLDTLEKQGKIEQVGITGRSVTYRRKL